MQNLFNITIFFLINNKRDKVLRFPTTPTTNVALCQIFSSDINENQKQN